MALSSDNDASMDYTQTQMTQSVIQPVGGRGELTESKTPNPSVFQRESTSVGIRKQESYASDHEVEQQSAEVEVEFKPWQTTLLRLGPIAGICALLLALLSVIFALAILLVSRGEAADWNVPPSSCLAICTAIGNQALRFAAFQGVAIAWWTKALHGSTFARLHSDWYAGSHLIGAVVAGRHMGWIGLACIFSSLVAIDGPFLQRATTIVSSQIGDIPVQLNITLSPEVPRPSTGGYVIANGTMSRNAKMFNSSVPSSAGSIPNNVHAVVGAYFIGQVDQPWWQEAALPHFIHGCPADSQCKAKLVAPALAVSSCSSRQTTVTRSDIWNNTYSLAAMEKAEYAPPAVNVPFLIQPSLVLGERESINLVSAYSEMPMCHGTINMTSCTLLSAIGEYDVSIHRGTVTLDKPIKPSILAIANNTQTVTTYNPTWGMYDSTLAGIVQAASTKWASYMVVFSTDGRSGDVHPVNPEVVENFVKYVSSAECISFRDPWNTVMESMNELMFYEGALDPTLARNNEPPTSEYYEHRLDPGLKVNSTVTGRLVGPHEVYSTNLWYFFAAAVIECLSIAFILPTYLGFWKLGRHVTFSPLEIAKAFEAPLLSQQESNSSARDLARTLGAKEIRYGVLPKGSESGSLKLAFADLSVVGPPQKGMRVG